MCADLHRYRPVAANEGGGSWTDDISLETGPTGDLWVTWRPPNTNKKSPTSLQVLAGLSLP
jgi:hypothetical protein